jgi:hypothetical protein
MNARAFVPRPYQRAIVDHERDVARCACWCFMGGGKTVSTLTFLAALQLVDPRPALVLAPLRVARSTWPDEAAKWAHLADTEVVPVVGTPEQRRRALGRPATVYTTNYEQVPWLVAHFGNRWPFSTIVADESTRLKSLRIDIRTKKSGEEYQRKSGGGMRARELARVAFLSDRFIELTGTCAPNGLLDLWGQAWFLDKGQRLGRVFSAYVARWFRTSLQGAIPVTTPLPHALDEITRALSDVCLSLDAADYFDLRAPIVHVVPVTLPPKAREQYKKLEREMFLALDSGETIEAVNAGAKTMKCLQFASGAAYVRPDAAAWEEVHTEKIQAVESILNEAAGASVLLAYHWRHDLERLRRAFPHARVLDDDPQTIRDWNAGKIQLLLAHPQSAGHGLNLQDGGSIIAFFSHWWDYEPYAQAIERIGAVRQAQSGHDRPVHIYHIVASHTVDETVVARRELKRRQQEAIARAVREGRPLPVDDIDTLPLAETIRSGALWQQFETEILQ